jgi:hypothetical protein
VFDLYGTERLTEWKKIRNEIEVVEDPYQTVSDLWSRAPFVNQFLDPHKPNSWPDPWRLILDDRYDDLAITLGMLYTFKLTQRFTDTECQIHMSVPGEIKITRFFLLIDNLVLNYQPRTVVKSNFLQNTNKIWQGTKLP